ncbi:MAG: hypothetical protein IJ088_15395 [Clostridia bacterium]|nr:hypothetical protein [Clostridia bacterium]
MDRCTGHAFGSRAKDAGMPGVERIMAAVPAKMAQGTSGGGIDVTGIQGYNENGF